MTRQSKRDNPGGTVSVRELVRRRMGVEADPWNLALVQRDEVWDQVRMRHLLDSLLAGYPIGAILLCRVSDPSQVIRVSAGGREVVEASASAWQLLDGQQRINALFSMLTREGQYGHFYLHMTRRREPPGPVSRRRSKDRALPHIAWRAAVAPGSDELLAEPLPERDRHIDLTGWFHWAETERHQLLQIQKRLDSDSGSVTSTLQSIDPAFADDLDPAEAEIAADRLSRLIDAWSEPSIPILATEVQTPLDVLEVFTRINLGGAPIVGTDVYFAAVKTFWPDAEESIDRVAAASPFLDRAGALRLISRLASRSLRQGDLLPLQVDRLAGPRGEPLVHAMAEISAADSPVVGRLEAVSTFLRTESALGYGLRVVNDQLWDEVFGWAATTPRDDPDWYAENLPVIDAYLLGATLFRYPSVLGDSYRRAALLEALSAGIGGGAFPLERIVLVTRAANAALRGSRQAVRTLHGSDEDRLWTTDWNPSLLLSVAQRIPYDVERPIDWDHIFPQAQAGRMWTLAESGRRVHHRHRPYVQSAGNLWALDASTNRALQDTPPAEKFDLLAEWQSAGRPYPVWTDDRWALSAAQVSEFVAVDRLLDDRPESIDLGMDRFRALTVGRANQLLDHAVERFPQAELFAADATVGASDPSSDLAGLLGALGISEPEVPAGEDPVDRPDAAASDGLGLGAEWADRDEELQWAIKEATRWHTTLTDPGGRSLPSGPGDGFDFRRYVRLRGQGSGCYIGVGIVSRFALVGESPFWLQLHDTIESFATLRARILGSPVAERRREDDGHVWVPLDVSPEYEWQGLADALTERVAEIRQVLEFPERSASNGSR